MRHLKDKGFATQAIHAGFDKCQHTGAVMAPIYLSTTFAQTAPGQPMGDYEYTRTHNPTRGYLESALATLENGKHAICFSSGCSALHTLLSTLPRPCHVIVSDDIYGGSLRIFNSLASEGLTYTQIDLCHLETLEKAIQPHTQLIWLETPSNPLLKIIDIQNIKARVASTPILLAVDSTFASPYLQRPLDLNADVVCHSTTKYLGGHSDILGGVLITHQDALADKIRFYQNAFGAVPSPMDCYFLLRSLKTLPVRMRQHCDNAKAVAAFLNQHPGVEKVHYPGLSQHPHHDIAANQMRDFGGMVSFTLKGNLDSAFSFLKRLEIFTLAESLGGVESLVEHPATMTHAAIPKAHREKIGIGDTLIRLSVGIEDIADLRNDLSNALML